MKLQSTKLLPPARRRPWQRKRPRPYPREIMIMDTPPLAQICIYADCVVLTRRDPSGAWRSYPISPEALAQALGKLPVSTGLLPSGTIGTGVKDGSAFYVQYIAPRAVALPALIGTAETIYRFETPPLIWAGWRTDYRLWALKATKTIGTDAPLYRAPFPNTYDSGGICWGNVKRLAATPAAMGSMLKLFLEESQFNLHLAQGKSQAQPSNVLQLYATLAPEQEYPLDDLIAAHSTLRDVLSGGVWRSL